jgi:hypothetical protein
LHVIVKMVNIELTPDSNPSYLGWTWHVEGMQNERIVAAAIYYASDVNVTDSRLGFRQCVRPPPHCPRDEYAGVEAMYDMTRDSPLVQGMGSVRTSAGRMPCFPNILQHRVEPSL